MKVLVKLIKFVILTIITTCIIGLGIAQVLKITIFDKNYVMQKLEETNFYFETYELVKSNFENYIYQSGLDEEILVDICPQKKVTQDINIMLSNIYDGTNKTIETQEIANNLNANIEKLEIKNKQNESAIKQFVEQICNEYKNTLNHTKYESEINNIYVKIISLLKKCTNIINIVLIMAIVLVMIINNKNFLRNLQDLGIAILSAGIFEIIICFIIKTKIYIQGIKIFNDVFSRSLVIVIQDIIQKVNNYGIIILIISLVEIISYAIITNFVQKKENK